MQILSCFSANNLSDLEGEHANIDSGLVGCPTDTVDVYILSYGHENEETACNTLQNTNHRERFAPQVLFTFHFDVDFWWTKHSLVAYHNYKLPTIASLSPDALLSDYLPSSRLPVRHTNTGKKLKHTQVQTCHPTAPPRSSLVLSWSAHLISPVPALAREEKYIIASLCPFIYYEVLAQNRAQSKTTLFLQKHWELQQTTKINVLVFFIYEKRQQKDHMGGVSWLEMSWSWEK